MNIKTLLLVTVVFGFCGGCVAVLVGAGAAGTVAYVKGDLTAYLDEDVEGVYNSSLKAMEELEIATISKKKDLLSAEITGRTAEDKKVSIKIKTTENDMTRLMIRVGFFGDESISRKIYDRIKGGV